MTYSTSTRNHRLKDTYAQITGDIKTVVTEYLNKVRMTPNGKIPWVVLDIDELLVPTRGMKYPLVTPYTLRHVAEDMLSTLNKIGDLHHWLQGHGINVAIISEKIYHRNDIGIAGFQRLYTRLGMGHLDDIAFRVHIMGEINDEGIIVAYVSDQDTDQLVCHAENIYLTSHENE